MLPDYMRATSISLLCAIVAAVGGASPGAAASQPTLAELVGQKLDGRDDAVGLAARARETR